MKFLVSRTSDRSYYSNPPCKNAVKTEVAYETTTWCCSGKFQTEVKTRDYHEIEINTLEELMDFCKEINEDVIITKNVWDESRVELEIYDDYRE